MIGVVLVAGVSRRLYPLTKNRPKCLLEVGPRTIFDHQMDALRSVGVKEVCLVLGYRREQIMAHAERHHSDLAIRPVVNHHFFESNTAASLWIARDQFQDRDMILLNGDVLFDPRILEQVVASGKAANLAVEAKPCGDEEVKVIVDDDDRITSIGKQVDETKCLGEYIGVASFSATFSTHFSRALDQLMHTDEGKDAYYEKAMDGMLADNHVTSVNITGLPCVEIDFPEDYASARQEIFPHFGS